jgi:glutaredoxin
MAKEYLASRGASYQDLNVATDMAARQAMIDASGQMGVPVIVIDGDVIVGFDKTRIDTHLAS